MRDPANQSGKLVREGFFSLRASSGLDQSVLRLEEGDSIGLVVNIQTDKNWPILNRRNETRKARCFLDHAGYARAWETLTSQQLCPTPSSMVFFR